MITNVNITIITIITILTITRCARGIRSSTQEFTCDNGFCIPLEQVDKHN